MTLYFLIHFCASFLNELIIFSRSFYVKPLYFFSRSFFMLSHCMFFSTPPWQHYSPCGWFSIRLWTLILLWCSYELTSSDGEEGPLKYWNFPLILLFEVKFFLIFFPLLALLLLITMLFMWNSYFPNSGF